MKEWNPYTTQYYCCWLTLYRPKTIEGSWWYSAGLANECIGILDFCIFIRRPKTIFRLTVRRFQSTVDASPRKATWQNRPGCVWWSLWRIHAWTGGTPAPAAEVEFRCFWPPSVRGDHSVGLSWPVWRLVMRLITWATREWRQPSAAAAAASCVRQHASVTCQHSRYCFTRLIKQYCSVHMDMARIIVGNVQTLYISVEMFRKGQAACGGILAQNVWHWKLSLYGPRCRLPNEQCYKTKLNTLKPLITTIVILLTSTIEYLLTYTTTVTILLLLKRKLRYYEKIVS